MVAVKEDFVLRIPEQLRPEAAAPILCAGVTTYSPLEHWGVERGSRVGVIGCGGSGHLACKLAKTMGAIVTVFTSTEDKLGAAERIGVQGVSTNDAQSFADLKSQFGFILSTILRSTTSTRCRVAEVEHEEVRFRYVIDMVSLKQSN